MMKEDIIWAMKNGLLLAGILILVMVGGNWAIGAIW